MSVRTAVRDAGPGDAEAVARLCAQLGYPVSAADVALRLAALLADARYWVGVAERDGCVVGWIVAEQRLTLEGGDTCEITGLVVDTAARRAGAGRLLVAAARGWAKSRYTDDERSLEHRTLGVARVLSRTRVRASQDAACVRDAHGDMSMWAARRRKRSMKTRTDRAGAACLSCRARTARG